ncbi:hypothetical protein T4B_10269 [Trichinella pseudospiralis]|uniref:Uncharacterized protein n=2 Tax=Trichinella pseudospiralis TaxID=6337 RepID=A0A0V1K6D3_TRIPS|nr:hypothetical protein T4E_1406 [Trichinella pseudospiralis]KRY79695.1 hypothetical protein T4A_314 [Trichinella pseudospiralis]KRY92788.1 hypothetical protein T4D_5329 [Trichinella pseudospiralis]KRZ30496.1 hypothetical protein T4B_10269 [Trichinella pseudospiralis]KRZ42782.1 hypothetical protein T4C_4664 [Trichinella pseudospiralis]
MFAHRGGQASVTNRPAPNSVTSIVSSAVRSHLKWRGKLACPLVDEYVSMVTIMPPVRSLTNLQQL